MRDFRDTFQSGARIAAVLAGGTTMPTYRFYKLTSGMRIAAPGEDRDFDGDISAFEHAVALANGHESACGRGRGLSRMWNRIRTRC